MNRSIWKGESSFEEKEWGHEIGWSSNLRLQGKVIYLQAGKSTSLKFNVQKEEVLFLHAGCVEIVFGPEAHFNDPVLYPAQRIILEPTKFLNIQAGCPYRISAKCDSIIYEISKGKTGVVRLEDDYGREINNSYSFVYPTENENDYRTK